MMLCLVRDYEQGAKLLLFVCGRPSSSVTRLRSFLSLDPQFPRAKYEMAAFYRPHWSSWWPQADRLQHADRLLPNWMQLLSFLATQVANLSVAKRLSACC